MDLNELGSGRGNFDAFEVLGFDGVVIGSVMHCMVNLGMSRVGTIRKVVECASYVLGSPLNGLSRSGENIRDSPEKSCRCLNINNEFCLLHT